MERWQIKKNSVIADIWFEWYMDIAAWIEIYKDRKVNQEWLLWKREFGTMDGFSI